MKKTNDWLLATAYNPTYDISDFQYIKKMSTDNTQFLSYDDYLKLDWIKDEEAFLDNNGNFSEDKLLQEYRKASSLWGQFSSESLTDNYTYSMWDRTAPATGKIRNPGFYMTRVLNPDDYTIGIDGFNNVTPSKKSWRELAQDNKIYDSKEQKFTDKSVNEISLFENPLDYFKSLFHDPLVYAVYDEDTEEYDPYVGLVVKHYKGEKKIDKFGNYYTETLNGRSLIGKELVSAFDYVTAEGTKINNYDFFDSDDRKKSVGGIIALNLVSIAPFFIPYVNTVYTGMVISKEMATTLPMLYGIIMGLTGSEDVESPLLNTIAAYGERLRTSTSDYAKENTFSFENIANLASMVVGQWNQCRMIGGGLATLSGKGKKAIATANALAFDKYNKEASKLLKEVYAGRLGYSQYAAYIGADSMSGFQKLLTSGKWAETPLGKAALLEYLVPAQQLLQRYNKLGLTLSIAYMSIICNTIVYDTVLLHGATPFEAACITLGSIAGMFSVDKFLGLGEIFFDPDETRLALKAATKNAAKSLMEKTDIIPGKKVTEKGIIGLMLRGAYAGRKVATDFVLNAREHTLGFVGKTVGVALENVAEQVAADVSQLFGEIAGKLGYFSLKDYGAWDNVFDRYLLNAIGGAFGGSMFYVQMAFLNRSNATKKLQKDLLYLLSTGRVTVDLINKLIDAAAKQGLLGSNELSTETTLDENGNTVYLSADNGRESQASYFARFLKNAVSALNLTIVGNNLNYTEDLLFDKMVLGEYKRLTLADMFGKDADNFKATSYITKFYDNYFKIVNNIANKEAEINELMSTTQDTRKSNPEYLNKLKALEEEKQLLINEKDYLFGEGSLGYVEKTLFAMDTKLNLGLIPLTEHQMARLLFYKPLNELTLSEQESLKEKYLLYTNLMANDLDAGYRLFKNMGKKINPDIQKMSEENLKQQIQTTEKLINNYNYDDITYDTKLENESDEEYTQRNTKKEGESDEAFLLRKQKREEKLKLLIDKNFSKWIDDVLELPLTNNIKRLLQAKIAARKKDIIEYSINKIDFSVLENEAADKVRERLRNVDFTNKEEVDKAINDIILQHYIPLALKLIGDTIGEVESQDAYDAITNYINDYGIEKNVDEFTYEDLYNIAVRRIMERNGYENESQITPEDIKEELDNIVEDFRPDWNRGVEPRPTGDDIKLIDEAIIAFYTKNNKKIAEYQDNHPYVSEKEYNELCKRTAETLFLASTDNSFLDAVKEIVSTPSYTDLIKVEQKHYINNPVIPLLKTIATIRLGNSNIDTILTEIYNTFNNVPTITDFRITELQLQELNLALNDMKIAKAYLYAASVSDNLKKPIGHNKAINDFVRNHPEVFKNTEQLPEISEDLANYLIHELLIFEQEANEWIRINDINKENRLQRFVRGAEKLDTTLVKFFKDNREAFKLSDDVDLLEGFEGYNNIIAKNDLLAVAVISLLLYNNFNNALKKGITEEQILKGLFDSVDNGGKGIIDLQEVITQYQALYDLNLSSGNITNYDKFLFIINSFAMSDYTFLESIRGFIENNADVCPLRLQEQAAKVAISHKYSKKVINKALEYVLEATGNKDKLPMLRSALIITGIGGAGKTYIISRLSIEGSKEIWLSGPGKSQIDNLSNNIKTGKQKSIEELLTMAVGSEVFSLISESITEDNENGNELNDKGLKYFHSTKYNNGLLTTLMLNDDVTINTITNKPDYIIIDEASWLGTHLLLILDAFCEKNDIELILIADLNLNGKNYLGLCENIDNESVFAWRTPELYLSLRDNTSVQKDRNLNGILAMLLPLRRTRSLEEMNSVATRLITDVLNKMKFKYYLQNNEFFGELVTDTLDNNILNILKGDICYIGNKDSAIEKILLNAGIKYDYHTADSVQGREYDYVIVDKDWNYDLNGARKGEQLKYLLKDVYTMISRSRQGTIIIDNNFSRFFKSTEDTTTGTNNDIKEAILNYRNKHITELDIVLQKMKELFPTTTPEPTPVKPEELPATKGETPSTEETPATLGEQPKAPFTPAEEDTPREAEDMSKEIEDINDLIEANLALANIDTPIRAYGNVHIGGITIAEHGGTWINSTASNRDLGIFVKPGETVSSLEDKRRVTYEVLKLKSLFHFGISKEKYNNAKSAQIRDIFSLDALQNAKYFIRIETPNDTNTLIGHTTLDNGKRAISNGKMATVITKIEGKDGKIYELSLGSLANPETWINNLPSIHKSLKNTVDKLNKKTTEYESTKKSGKASSDITEAIERLKALILRIQEYDSNLDIQAKQYSDNLSNIIKLATGESYDYEIDAPTFTGLTTLVDTHDKIAYRLEHLSDIDESAVYSELNEYATVSNPYIVRSSPFDISERMKGRAVMFVSSDPYIEANELVGLYIKLKENPDITPRVRMVALSNLGVSFKSLYKRWDNEKYKTVYKSKDGKEYTRYIPFENQINGIRMYSTFWNFRAAITRFVEEVKAFKENKITTDDALTKAKNAYQNTLNELARNNPMSEEELLRILKLDSDLYAKYNARRKSGDPYLSEDLYRSTVNTDTEVNANEKAALAYVWEFNDYLGREGLREFRLGYSLKNGFYTRRLTHLESDVYKDVTNPIGVYINPDLATDYMNVMNAIFTNIIDNIIPPAYSDTRAFMTDSDNYTTLSKHVSWFLDAENNAKLNIPICDSNGNILEGLNIVVEGDGYHAFSALSGILISTARHLYFAKLQDYMENVVANPKRSEIKYDPNKIHKAKSSDENSEIKLLSWLPILGALSNPIEGLDPDGTLTINLNDNLKSNVVLNKSLGDKTITFKDDILPPGIIKSTYLTEYRLYDMRLENLFDLIFHGHIVDSHNEDNISKDNGTLRATDAYFKYGIFVDPVRAINMRNDSSAIGGTFFEQLLSGALYGADKVAGFPQMAVSLKPKTEVIATETIADEKKITTEPEKAKTKVFEFAQKIGEIFNLNINNEIIELLGITDVLDLINNLLTNLLLTLSERIQGNQDIMDNAISINVDTNNNPIITTVRDIIKNKTGLNDFTVENQKIDDNGHLVLSLNTGDQIEIYKTTDTNIAIEPKKKTVAEVLESVNTIEKLVSVLLDNISKAIDTLDVNVEIKNKIKDDIIPTDVEEGNNIVYNIITEQLGNDLLELTDRKELPNIIRIILDNINTIVNDINDEFKLEQDNINSIVNIINQSIDKYKDNGNC